MAKFRTRARTVDMLGRQQIAGVPNAISELFKNAHDAYADHVDVDYFLQSKLFVLRDNGIGMTLKEFEERWLTIGTESKMQEEEAPKDPEKPKRPISGEKGIGRLAIAAIGPQVLVLTRAIRSNERSNLVAAFIHWGLFELPGINLDEINIPLKQFSGDKLPEKSDIDAMLSEVRQTLTNLSNRISSEALSKICADLDRFDFDIPELSRYLERYNPALSLENLGRGTHFFISPVTDTIEDDIRLDTRESDEISSLSRLLVGFVDTMTPDSKPLIKPAFRYWADSLRPANDILDESEFWSPNDLERADHQISGSFDEYGRFRGKIRVYRNQPVDYDLPWSGAQGNPTECGPFRLELGYVPGGQRDSVLSPSDFADFNRRLVRIGGLYVFRNGIRILPYGDVDYDWLEIETRRSKGAGYYFFSHRRMLGAVQISRTHNHLLEEKAGREGFRENKAYREFRRILINFFTQVAADHFRGKSPNQEFIQERKARRAIAKQRAEEQGQTLRSRFARRLDAVLQQFNNEEPEIRVAEMLNTVKSSMIRAANEIGDLFGNHPIIRLEAKANADLLRLKDTFRIEQPEEVALTDELERDWLLYLEEFDRLDREIFQSAQQKIHAFAVESASTAQLMINRRERTKILFETATTTSLAKISEARHATESSIDNMRRRVYELLNTITEEANIIATQIREQIDGIDLDTISDEELEKQRMEWEHRLQRSAGDSLSITEFIQRQLEEVDWHHQGEMLISKAEMSAAQVEELLALRDQVDRNLELAQLGMAIEIISHEFSSTIRGIRAGIRDLQRWTNSNPKLQPVYQNIRSNFEHLDGYLNLFTPLYRRLYRQAIDIQGADIAQFLKKLFDERLVRHQIQLVVTEEYRQAVVHGYPSTFYPVFVNLLDNAIFWLTDRQPSREICLDADELGFLVMDTGPGISANDRKAIFEMGFTRKPGGRGLGLYIAKEVLAREDCQLLLESPRNSYNTVFRIALPEQKDG